MKFWNIAKEVLSILVIPVLVWAVSVQVKNAVQDSEITELRSQLNELKGREEGIRQNSLKLVEVSTKLDGVQGKVDEANHLIRRLLEDR